MDRVHRRLLAIVFLGAVALSSHASFAAVIRVPEDYPTFRAGLQAAMPGDLVLVASGIYNEPGDPVLVRAGVRVLGSGWELNPLGGTVLEGIPLFFGAGNDSAVVEQLAIADRQVSSENSLGTVRGCAIGEGTYGSWADGFVAEVRGGIIIEHCLIRCDISSAPRKALSIQGGRVTIRHNVIALPSAAAVLEVSPSGPYPLGRVAITDNTFFANTALPIIIRDTGAMNASIAIVNNILQAAWIGLTCVTQAPVEIDYNCLSAFSLQNLCGQLGARNLHADPLLCNPAFQGSVLNDFALNALSPCIGAGIDGTTIGALEVGCGIAGISVGSVPSHDRIQIEILPNPVTAASNIMLPGSARASGVVEIWDSTGRAISQRSFGSMPERIRLKDLIADAEATSGVFFCRVRTEDGKQGVARYLLIK